MFSHPFSYLTLTAVLFAPISRFLAKVINAFFEGLVRAVSAPSRLLLDSPNIRETREETSHASFLAFLRDMPDPSVETIIKVAFPTILTVTILAAMAGTVVQRFSSVRRVDFVRAVCFISGFQFVIFTISVSILGSFDLLFQSDLLKPRQYKLWDAVFGVLACLLLYALLWPALHLFFLLSEGRARSKIKLWLKTVASSAAAIVLSCLFLASAISVSLIPLGFESPKKPPPLEHLWSVESFELVDGNRIDARVLLTSERARPYLILDKPISLSIYKRSGWFSKEKIATAPLALIAWSDRDHPVMELRKGESKWLMLGGTLDPSFVKELEDSSKGSPVLLITLKGFGQNDYVFVEVDWNPRGKSR